MASSAVITSIVAERLCGSIPITTPPGMRSDLDTINFSNARSTTGYRAGRATLLRVRQTLLEPLLALTRRPARAGQMRATRPAWAAERERRAERQDRASPGPVLGAIQQAADDRAPLPTHDHPPPRVLVHDQRRSDRRTVLTCRALLPAPRPVRGAPRKLSRKGHLGANLHRAGLPGRPNMRTRADRAVPAWRFPIREPCGSPGTQGIQRPRRVAAKRGGAPLGGGF
jgi:hypothetical protein